MASQPHDSNESNESNDSNGSFDELDKLRKALKHVRIKRDRIPRNEKEAKQKAEEKVTDLEKQRDDLYEKLGRRTASKLEHAQADHAGGAGLVRKAMSMLQTGLSRMEGAQRDTQAAASSIQGTDTEPTNEEVEEEANPTKRRRTSKQNETAVRDTTQATKATTAALEAQNSRSTTPSVAASATGKLAADASTQQPDKKKRRTASAASGDLLSEINNGLQLAFMPPPAADRLLKFCKRSLSEACRIHTGRFKTLSRQAAKLFCYDVDAQGWAPQDKFADMAPKDYHLRHSGIRGTLLEGLVRHVNETYGVEVNHIVINCYPSKADYIPSHKDQPLSLESASNRVETKDSVFVYCLGASRPLCFLRDDGGSQLWGKKERSEMDVLCEVQTVHNSLYQLTGRVNEQCLHCVPVENSKGKAEELRFSITLRAAHRLKVNATEGKYASFNGKKWETRDLPQCAATSTDETTVQQPAMAE